MLPGPVVAPREGRQWWLSHSMCFWHVQGLLYCADPQRPATPYASSLTPLPGSSNDARGITLPAKPQTPQGDHEGKPNTKHSVLGERQAEQHTGLDVGMAASETSSNPQHWDWVMGSERSCTHKNAERGHSWWPQKWHKMSPVLTQGTEGHCVPKAEAHEVLWDNSPLSRSRTQRFPQQETQQPQQGDPTQTSEQQHRTTPPPGWLARVEAVIPHLPAAAADPQHRTHALLEPTERGSPARCAGETPPSTISARSP